MRMISSPCIKVCVIDATAQICAGCGRSLDEIARWGRMREEERLAIMATLEDRMMQKGLMPPAS
jgi:uncharacterized protein